MGKKDLSGKIFFTDRERFSELMNAVLYQGRKVIQAQGLVLVHRNYPSPLGNGEMNRDILMMDARENIYYGLELETESDYSMPERVVGYDACEFEYQIREILKEHEKRQETKNYREIKSRMKKEDFLYPVITVVLYLGIGHWQGRRQKEGLVMCKALDELMEDKRIEGEKEGERKVRISIVHKMLNEGMDEELIRRVTGCSQNELAVAAK